MKSVTKAGAGVQVVQSMCMTAFPLAQTHFRSSKHLLQRVGDDVVTTELSGFVAEMSVARVSILNSAGVPRVTPPRDPPVN